MLSDHRSAIKLVSNLVVTTSVGKVVKQVIAANVEPETAIETAQVWIGTFAIGGMVAERCWNRTEPNVDKVIDFIDKWQEERNNPDHIEG